MEIKSEPLRRRMKQILCLIDTTEHPSHRLEFAAKAAVKIQGNILLYEWPSNPQKDSNDKQDQATKSVEEKTTSILKIMDALSKKYGITPHYAYHQASGDTDKKIIGNLATASEAVVVSSNQASALLKIFSEHPQRLLIQCPVIIIPDYHRAYEPEQLVYLHKNRINPWAEIVLPAWWSQLLGIHFNIWTDPNEAINLNDSPEARLSDLIQYTQHEKVISSIGEHTDPEPEKNEPGTIYALAFNDELEENENFLDGFIQKSVNPILVFDVG